jgi:hypothetical protein
MGYQQGLLSGSAKENMKHGGLEEKIRRPKNYLIVD